MKRCGCSASITPAVAGRCSTPGTRRSARAVDVVPVEILNRERFATLRQLVDEVNDQLRSALDGPHVFFGHSFGALLAYRLACLRAASGSPSPRALIVSSFAPPHLPAPIPAVDHLDDHQLTALLSDLGGIPPELDRMARSARAEPSRRPESTCDCA